MAIGFTPIIPMNPVQPNPEARFQRFGVNDSQLFGKPLLGDLAAPKAKSPQLQPAKAPSPTTAQTPLQKLQGNPEPGTGVTVKASAASPGSLGQPGNRSGVQKTTQLGSNLDIKA